MADDSQKITVLLSALNERYQAQRTIRERVQSVGLAVIGLLLGAAGWLIQSDKLFTCPEKAFAITGLLVAVGVLRFVYLRDLQRGFRTQQLVTVKIEKALGLYTAGAFAGEPHSIYPDGWAQAGSKDGPGAFFQATYLLIYVGTLFLVATILFAA